MKKIRWRARAANLVDAFVARLPSSLLLPIAQMLAKSRPIGPYPGWYFGVADSQPRLDTWLRLAIWRACNTRNLQQPIEMRWYDGLRVRVYLGNDMSRTLFVGGCVEPNEFHFLGEVLREGMTFVDIGANDGLYSLLASRRVGAAGVVMAIEPSGREFERLQSNLRVNRVTNVQPFLLALSDRDGSAALRVAGYEHEGHNTLGDFVYDSVQLSHIEPVTLRRLDDLVEEQNLKRVDVIKLDVEGAEHAVLEGGRRAVSTFRPLLLLELCDAALRRQGSSAAQVIALLRSLGYEIFTFDQATGQPVRAGESVELSENIVAAHAGRPWNALSTGVHSL